MANHAHWLTHLLLTFALHTTATRAAELQSRYVEAYPNAASKKGLQVEIVDDALALGVKHAALNVNLSQVVAPEAVGVDPQQPHWRYGDRDYLFNAAYVHKLDRDVKALSDHGVIVNLILLVYESPNAQINRRMLHPSYDPAAPNRLGAFNTRTEIGRQWLAATMEFLAERWSRPDRKYGRVCGYIVGNEVNSHWWWCNMGSPTMQQFADDYLDAVRIVHGAVRRQASWPRVYISLEHHWNMRYAAGDATQAFGGKEFVDYFAEQARRTEGGNFEWHVAFHPYPENLFEPRFWDDRTALPHFDTPRITLKNLEVLAKYMRRPELLYDGKPRRIILSEQGFHTPEGDDGEAIQAAAYCLAYKKVETIDGIDAFILHRHVDHPHEGGLHLGLRRYLPRETNPRPKKQIYECFRQADAPEWETAFQFALPIVGLDKWDLH